MLSPTPAKPRSGDPNFTTPAVALFVTTRAEPARSGGELPLSAVYRKTPKGGTENETVSSEFPPNEFNGVPWSLKKLIDPEAAADDEGFVTSTEETNPAPT